MSLPEDRDLIPDEWQSGSGEEGKQKFETPPPPPKAPAPKQGVLGRLFGAKSTPPGEASTERKIKPLAPKPAKSRESIDLSKGPLRGERIRNRSQFRADLSKTLGRNFLQPGQKKDLIDDLTPLRRHGFNAAETKKTLWEAYKAGQISKTQYNIGKRKLGANKSSSWF